jgi:hypothetical protein
MGLISGCCRDIFISKLVCAALLCALLCTCAGGATLIFETELMDVEGDDDEYEGGL